MAVLVLAVVAVVGSTSSTKAATGSIFVANEWSKVTNESPAPSTYVTAGTVYGTTSDSTVRLIQTDSDLIRVVVTDTGKDDLTPVAVAAADIEVDDAGDGPAGATDATITSVGAGEAVTIFLTGQVPIAGANSTIEILVDVNGTNVGQISTNVLSIVARFDGVAASTNPTVDAIDPWIRVQRNTGYADLTITGIGYKTSVRNNIEILVTSELESGTIKVKALESGLSTGRFVGFVKLVRSTISASTGSTVAGDKLAEIRTTVGPVTLSYTDSGSVVRTTQVQVDTSAPSASVTGPVNATATQNRTPTFSGSISDGGSGLKIDQIHVLIDNTADAANAAAVVDAAGANVGTPTSLAPSTSGASDGDAAFSFSKAAVSDLPAIGSVVPDHIVDWLIKASDVAGNIGFSDADPASVAASGAGNILGGFQIHTVKIDRLAPSFTDTVGNHKTGVTLASTGAEVISRRSLRIVFNDQVSGIEASDFTVTLDNLDKIVPTSVIVLNNPKGPAPKPNFPNGGVVYLEFATDLVSSESPTVALQDQILDLAGNSTTQASASVVDGIAPKITVTFKNGTGTGTGAEGSDQLTKSTIVVE
ncbi:MAG: hypothetical protein O3B04_08480, partial [Chloroflexi bacterium]|nr:hypothetical protein [Chloroflexota bacterium]